MCSIQTCVLVGHCGLILSGHSHFYLNAVVIHHPLNVSVNIDAVVSDAAALLRNLRGI